MTRVTELSTFHVTERSRHLHGMDLMSREQTETVRRIHHSTPDEVWVVCDQQRELAAMRDFYPECSGTPVTIHEEPDALPGSRVMFTAEIERWFNACQMFGNGGLTMKKVAVNGVFYLEF